MANKPHLKFLGEEQRSETGSVKFNPMYNPDKKETDRVPQDYYLMARDLRSDLISFQRNIEIRKSQKLPEIEVPYNVSYVDVVFHGQFNISEFYNVWYTTFGLEAVSYKNFNCQVLFAIIDLEKFDVFIENLKAFIAFGYEGNKASEFSELIIYLREFELLTSNDILKFRPSELGEVVVLQTIDLPLDYKIEEEIIVALLAYLDANQIAYIIDRKNDRLELFNATYDQIFIIASHFDIIESITCSISGRVRPSLFNIPVRDFGFKISNAKEDLPLIGIIDTGISMNTPLKAILIQDETFTLDGSSPLIDVAGRHGEGHGTMVAGLAALGRMNHLNNFEGEVLADAKLLSIKLSNTGSGYFSELKILEILTNAKAKYPEMRIFVLTLAHNRFKATNETYSTYTYLLDKFSFENDCLIFIATGNNDNCINENSKYDLGYFNSEHTNLCTPADSMNNMTVGAASEGLSGDYLNRVSDGPEYPTLFTRKSHIDLTAFLSSNKANRHFFKPDIIECGGDVGWYNSTTLDFTDLPALSALSSKPAIGYVRETGTSISAPLAANIAAKIIKLYPDLRMQTVKAMIINGASINNLRFTKPYSHLLNKTAGNGFVDLEKTLYSNENSATIILEDIIAHNDQKIFPINFPKYLTTDTCKKNQGVLKVTATLCFDFMPIQHNQLAYCPIHIAFSVFRNHTSEQINTKRDAVDSLLRSNLSWSQNGRYKAKPIPHTNRQKIHFNVDINQLQEEGYTFKLAVQARLSSQLLKSEIDSYSKEYPFSIVMRLEETVRQPTNKLYEEIQLVNIVEVIADAEAEGTIEI